MDRLKQFGPSVIELEIRSLSENNGGSIELMAAFVEAMEAALRTKQDYELVNSYMALFMKLHGDSILDNDGKVLLRSLQISGNVCKVTNFLSNLSITGAFPLLQTFVRDCSRYPRSRTTLMRT